VLRRLLRDVEAILRGVGHAAAQRPAVPLGVLGGVLVVDRLVATGEADSLGVFLLDLLRQQADLIGLVALVAVAVDRLPVVGLTDGADVFLQPLIGKDGAGGRLGVALSRQGTGALRDVGEDLRGLERVGLLLLELIVEGGVLRLLGLLLHAARLELRLRALQGRRLRARRQASLSASLGLALSELLVANPGQSAGGLLQSRPVSLVSGQVHALLLLGRAEGGVEALAGDVRVDVGVGEVLLLLQICRSDTRPVTAKRAGLNRGP
jgi:hypothetical protein